MMSDNNYDDDDFADEYAEDAFDEEAASPSSSPPRPAPQEQPTVVPSRVAKLVSTDTQSEPAAPVASAGVQAPDDLGAAMGAPLAAAAPLSARAYASLAAAGTAVEALLEEVVTETSLRPAATRAAAGGRATIAAATPTWAELLPPPAPSVAAATASGSAAEAWALLAAGRTVVSIAQSPARSGDFAVALSASTATGVASSCALVGVWASARVGALLGATSMARAPTLVLSAPGWAGGGVTALAWTAAGDVLLAGTADGAVLAWALGEPTWLHGGAFPTGVRSPSFDSRGAAAASSRAVDASETPAVAGGDVAIIALVCRSDRDDDVFDDEEASAGGGVREGGGTGSDEVDGGNRTGDVGPMSADALFAKLAASAPRLSAGAGLSSLLMRGSPSARAAARKLPPTGLAFIPPQSRAGDTSAPPVEPFRVAAVDAGARVQRWVGLPLPPPRSLALGGVISLEALADTSADPGRAATGLLRLVPATDGGGGVGNTGASAVESAVFVDGPLGVTALGAACVSRAGDSLLIATDAGDVWMVRRDTRATRRYFRDTGLSGTPCAAATAVASSAASGGASGLMAVGYADGAVAFYLQSRTTPLALSRAPLPGGAPIVGLVWLRAQPGVLAAMAADGGFALWDVRSTSGTQLAVPTVVSAAPLKSGEKLLALAAAGGAASPTSGATVALPALTTLGRVVVAALHPVFTLNRSLTKKFDVKAEDASG